MTPRAPIFLGSEIYRGSSYGMDHPLRVPRVSTVMDLGRALGWLTPENYRNSPRAKPAALHLWHHPDYIAALVQAEKDQKVSADIRARYHLGSRANPVFPEMFRRPATAAGASMLAATLLAKGGVVHHPGGGTHHGLPDRANGFCYLNDPVLAILSLRKLGITRVAYLDIDAHHPDGVEFAFADDPRILMISVHEENRWPRSGALNARGAGNVFNLPVPRGLNDSEMAEIRDRLILPQLMAHRPEAIVLQCGADALAEDPLSHLMLSNNAHIAVLRGIWGLSPRLLVLGGGGYNPWSVGRLWTRLWGEMNGYEIPPHLPAKAREVLGALGQNLFRQRSAPEPYWYDSLIDPPREGPIRPEINQRLAQLCGVMV
ncbi:MAG: acetoin utilization protein AcuC [Mangrovicoccus sp.]|nr:acetoin utilization protein AcuC [Mangrovicoccus sp.]